MVFNERYSFPVNDYSGVFGTLCKMAQPASPASVLDATCKHLGWRVDALGAPHIGERSEAKLIVVEKIGHAQRGLPALQ